MAWDNLPTGFADVAEKALTQMQKDIALDALQMVITGSPVDQGAFRGNHRLSIRQRDTGYDESAGSPSPPRGGMDTEALHAGMRVLATLNAPFTVVYIQNNLPYAERLEAGSSEQAPAGVYAIAYNSLREKYGR